MTSVNQEYKQLNFEIIKKLGDGSFATVREVRYKNQNVAAKIFDRFKKSYRFKVFHTEIQQLKRLNHDNIIKIVDYGKYKENDYSILLELADSSLEYLLHETEDNYSLGKAISWLYQIASAINYLHSYNSPPVIHRDLKPSNLLLMNSGKIIKICDFGTTCDLRSTMTKDKGTPLYIAPEVYVPDTRYDEKCDIFSYGIILWEVFCRKKPYSDQKNHSSYQIQYKVKNGLRPRKISNCPKILSILYERTIDASAKKRPKISHIYKILEYLNRIINFVQISKNNSELKTSSKEHCQLLMEINKLDRQADEFKREKKALETFLKYLEHKKKLKEEMQQLELELNS